MATVPRRPPLPHRPRRPLAMPTDPASEVRRIAVEIVQLHATLTPATTPEAVMDALADAHANLVAALAALRTARVALAHDGRHRDDSAAGAEVHAFREDAEALFGTDYRGRHGGGAA